MTSPSPPDQRPGGPSPTPLPLPRAEPRITDSQAMEALHRLLNRPGDWNADTFDEIQTVIFATGRRLIEVGDITAEVEHDDNDWPVARVEADQLTVFIRQAPDGGICLDLFPYDSAARDILRVLINGEVILGLPLSEPPATEEPVPGAGHSPVGGSAR